MNDQPSSGLTYRDEKGVEVKTALFLKNRGSCCKTSCRHCPYGFTLRNKGLQFSDYDPNLRSLAETFLGSPKENPEGDIAASLLADGFGKSKKSSPLETHSPKALKFVLLKGRKIGLIAVSNIRVVDLFLHKHYRDQGIDIPTVESFYFS
ncbi:MAG: DUF5522 domain-containing protein [Bacteriovoracales bacterium]|nr:DUF5522 domain-containing protein [Bacteriovoracales bacterium]